MPAPSVTTTFDSFFTLTITNYGEPMAENFVHHRPGMKYFFDGYSKTDSNGGRVFQLPSEYGYNENVKFFQGDETFALEPTDNARPLMTDWCYIGGPMRVTTQELLENSGASRLASLGEMRMRATLRSVALIINQEIYGDGTNYGSKGFQGLGGAVSATPASGTVMGLSKADYSWWTNNYQSIGSWAANGINGATTDLFLQLYNDCCDGETKPAVIFSAQDVWQRYHRANAQGIRYVGGGGAGKKADGGFPVLEYMGTEWYWDRQCPDGTGFMANNDAAYFMVDPRYRLQWSAPRASMNQWSESRLVGLRFAMVYTRLMSLGRFDGVTA